MNNIKQYNHDNSGGDHEISCATCMDTRIANYRFMMVKHGNNLGLKRRFTV